MNKFMVKVSLLAGCIILAYACSEIDTDTGLRDSVNEGLLLHGQIFKQFSNFKSLKSPPVITNDEAVFEVEFEHHDSKITVSIQGVKTYRLYNDPVFFRYVNLRDFASSVREGRLLAIGSVEYTMDTRRQMPEITAFLSRSSDSDGPKWHFVTEWLSPYRRLLGTVREAYRDVENSEFKKLIGSNHE